MMPMMPTREFYDRILKKERLDLKKKEDAILLKINNKECDNDSSSEAIELKSLRDVRKLPGFRK